MQPTNTMQASTTNRLTVFVRCKPIENQKSVIDIIDDTTLIFDPIDPENEPTNEYFYHGKKFKSIGAKKNKNSSYTFDRVFDRYSTNYNIYETVTKPMVNATINGLNCTVFAYGATGSGKTYTMLGKVNNPGVIYYTSKDLFGKLNTISETDPLPPELKICYFEIYNEKVRDLLVFEPKNFIECGNKRLRTTPERCRARQQLVARDNYNLPVCEAPGDGVALVIPDLTYHTPRNAEELIDLLESGNANRSQHPTDANADSSRSHAIFQIVLTRRTRRNSGTADYQLQTSKISLIDLAGSERASVAYRAGNDRSKNLQREGGNINKSLLALGNCINALADPRKGHKHIPYRNSKLTRILRDSLGGSCKTAMIATVCQHISHYDDTQNTLMYASRAKCIKLKPGRNFQDIAIQPKNYSIVIENQNRQITSQQIQIDKLKIENEELKNELSKIEASSKKGFPQPQTSARTSNFLQESKYIRELEELYDNRRLLKSDMLKISIEAKKNELKLFYKRLDEAKSHDELNSQEQFRAIESKLDYYNQELRKLNEEFRYNDMCIRDKVACMTTEFEFSDYGTPEEFEAIIEPYKRERDLLQDLEDKNAKEQYAFDLAYDALDKYITAKDLLQDTSVMLKKLHTIMRGRGLNLSDETESKLAQLFKKLEGKKNVNWKDDRYEIENGPENRPPLLDFHEVFNIVSTPFRNNNTLLSRRLSKNLVSLTNYTPEQSNNITFDASQ